jgi:hypothetical protein
MNLSDNHKKALLIFGGALVIFLYIKNKREKKKTETVSEPPKKVDNFVSFVPEPDKRKKVPNPKMNPKDASKNSKANDALKALKAYINAYNAKEPKSVLDELNNELESEFGLKVCRKSSGTFVVKDMNGKEIMSNE